MFYKYLSERILCTGYNTSLVYMHNIHSVLMRHYLATEVTAQPHALATLLPEEESAVSIGQEAKLAPERVRTLCLSPANRTTIPRSSST
jgi:hypothetical protein